MDTRQFWSAFEHILPLNQFERRFWWLILHLLGQGIIYLLNYNIFGVIQDSAKKMTENTYFNSMHF